MHIYVGQDWHGNVYISDDKDTLPPDLTDFHTNYLPDYSRFAEREGSNLNIQIGNVSIFCGVKEEVNIDT